MPPCIGVAMNTVGVDTSLSTFCPAAASCPESGSTIAQLLHEASHDVRSASAQGSRCVPGDLPGYVENPAISWKPASRPLVRSLPASAHPVPPGNSSSDSEIQRVLRGRDPPSTAHPG